LKHRHLLIIRANGIEERVVVLALGALVQGIGLDWRIIAMVPIAVSISDSTTNAAEDGGYHTDDDADDGGDTERGRDDDLGRQRKRLFTRVAENGAGVHQEVADKEVTIARSHNHTLWIGIVERRVTDDRSGRAA